MEAQLGALDAAAQLLLKFEINLKKTARDRRTLPFITTRAQVLEQYWSHFLSSYLKFIQLPGAKDSEYVTGDTFTDVQECYLDCKALLLHWTPPV